MKYFFDTEFLEDGKTIDLISIGIVAEDGREYYAVSTQFNMRKARKHPFVREHVLPKLPGRHPIPPPRGSPNEWQKARSWKPRNQIAQEVVAFVGTDPEFWADYAAYDWLALCQLYGTMLNLPKTWPYFCRDVQQLRDYFGLSFTDQPNHETEHDALSDARECKIRHSICQLAREGRQYRIGMLGEVSA